MNKSDNQKNIVPVIRQPKIYNRDKQFVVLNHYDYKPDRTA